MTTTQRETPDVHDAHAGQPTVRAIYEKGHVDPVRFETALPTPSTPGYTTFTDYLGNRWTCCDCMAAYLPVLQLRWKQLGWIKSGLDVWQLTGNAGASAGTHSQGGAGDLLYQTDDKFVNYLRDHGATAAWRRTTAQGFTKQHLHFVLRGCPHNAPARYQVVEEQSGPPAGASAKGYHGGDGLTGVAFDYHRDPVKYMNWDAGLNLMKREAGLLALATTTTLNLAAQPMSKGSYVLTTAVTSQPGTAFVTGTHVFEYLPTGSTTWVQYKTVVPVNGKSTFLWNYGGPQPIRVRFVPKDALYSKPSTSPSVAPNVVDVPAVQKQLSAAQASATAFQAKAADAEARLGILTAKVADLQAQLDAANNPPTPSPTPPVTPPEPVPAYGVDVSAWQSLAQVQALVADPGVSFVLVKATQGLAYVSPTFEPFRQAAGPKFAGAYHFCETGHDALAEADHFLAVAPSSARVLALDIETAVTPDFVLAWLDRVKAVSGRTPIVYLNWNWLKQLRAACAYDQWNRLVEYPLWLADISEPGSFPTVDPAAGSTRTWPVVLHQYATTPDSTGSNVDRDFAPDLSRLLS